MTGSRPIRMTPETAGELAGLIPDQALGDVRTHWRRHGRQIDDMTRRRRGGSGGPVLNQHGEVVGINSAYIDGFSGGDTWITAGELRPLMETAKHAGVVTAAVVTK